jgi:hypothetical protein
MGPLFFLGLFDDNYTSRISNLRRTGAAQRLRGYEYLTAILKQLESSFVPPVPPLMREPLKELLANLSTPLVQHPWKGKRAGKAKVPKRYESACRRIERLLAEGKNATGTQL